MENIPKLEDIAVAFPDLENIEFIQTGGFKAVYKVAYLGKQEALKIIYIPSNNDEDYNAIGDRTKREINLLSQIKSPFIVKLGNIETQIKEINGCNYICYSEEFLQGKSLRELIKDNYTASFKDLKTLFLEMLNVLESFKPLNIIHRDIKPENIIKTDILGREYVLLDLGVAFIKDGLNFTTNQSAIPGTLNYYAPEMLKANFRANLDFRADLYAVALTIYEFATKRNPLVESNGDIAQTLQNIGFKETLNLQNVRTDLPVEFCELINQSLKKIPALRPGNIERLIKQVEAIV